VLTTVMPSAGGKKESSIWESRGAAR